MKSEGYPDEQIKRAFEEVQASQHNRIHKCFCRLKVFGDPKKKLMIKAFDHFAMAIKMRKMLRYWLNFSNNRV